MRQAYEQTHFDSSHTEPEQPQQVGDVLARHEQLEWDDLRGRLAADSAIGLALCGWLTAWYLLEAPETGLLPVLIAVLLICLGVWLWTQSEQHPQRTAVLVTVLAFTAVTMGWYSLQLPALAYVFAIPIMLTTLLSRTWVTLLTGFLVWLLLYGPLAPPVDVPETVSAILLLLCAFQVLVMRSVRKHLIQSQSYQTHVIELLEQTRKGQEEVNRLNKSLALAYSLLHRRAQELASARQETENALRMKEQFAVYVSHELRTPLNIMLGFLEILQRYPEVYGDVQWTPTLRRDIAEIQRSARHLLDLVNDLLDLARIDAVKMPLNRGTCRIEGVLKEAIDLIQRLVVQSPVNLHLTVDDNLPELYIDQTRIRQVALNLLANATRFTQAGEIHVHVGQVMDELIVSVRDTGSGIPPEQLPKLFQDYTQISPSAGSNDGKGLGLAIAKRFVQMHGGRIWAESRVGTGSTFFFSLPLNTVHVSSTVRRSVIAQTAKSVRSHLLVVDEDESVGAYLRRHLENFRISQVASMEQAGRAVREEHPDALVFNIAPDRETQIWATPPPILPEGVPLIQCTLPVGKWRLEDDCFDNWLVKPVESRRLLQLMDHYCPAGGKILLADDDRSFVELVRRILQAAPRPFELEWAHSLEEGLTKLEQMTPDLLLVDIALAGSDGRRLAQRVRSRKLDPPIAVVAISSFAPGKDGDPSRSSSFALTRKEGFSENEVLDLIQQIAGQVRPRYGPWSLDAESLAVPGAITAS